MFLFSNKCGNAPHLFLTRGICCSSVYHTNHYVILGLTPAATPTEVKKAYFELCKKYHPDKNDGSVESTRMFRKITEAYEILGNEKLRRLYDQKMFHPGPVMNQTAPQREDYNYEAERDFYERTHMRQSYRGKTQYYDFDAWTNAHYPKSRGKEQKPPRNSSRTWVKSRHGRYQFYAKIYRVRVITLNIIGILLLGVILTSMPTIYIPDQNYGIPYDLAKGKIEIETSESEKSKYDLNNP